MYVYLYMYIYTYICIYVCNFKLDFTDITYLRILGGTWWYGLYILFQKKPKLGYWDILSPKFIKILNYIKFYAKYLEKFWPRKSNWEINIRFSVPKCFNTPILYTTDAHFYNLSVKICSIIFLIFSHTKICDMVKHELRVTSNKFRDASYELLVVSRKFKSRSWNSKVRTQILELRVQIYEFKSKSYEFKSTSYELKSVIYKFRFTSNKFKSINSRII